LEQISSGALQPGQRLGGERDLAVEFGVSRSSLRQALAALERDGIVRRVSGRSGGTFVSAHKVDRDLSRIVGVPALLRDQGFVAGSKVVSATVIPADAATAKYLNLEAGEFICDLTRIRLADGSPLSLEHLRLPAARFPGLLDLPLGGSIYELLEHHFRVKPATAEERIEVASATDEEALILGVPLGAPLMSIVRTSVDDDGVPIEHSHDLFRADRIRISVRTRGDATTAASGSSRHGLVEVETHTD
jgi:GntR family transcriptional regulator